MVAIVTGAGLGLDTSSAKVFAAVGQQGGELGDATFGRYGENVYVNAATGNLAIDRTDEVLIGQGPDDIITRSYNSLSGNQGYLTQHDWQISDSRDITALTGLVNAPGSTVTRIDSDGSNTTYTYDGASGAYVCHQAGSAEYRLTFDSKQRNVVGIALKIAKQTRQLWLRRCGVAYLHENGSGKQPNGRIDHKTLPVRRLE